MDTKMSGTQDSNASANSESCQDYSLQPGNFLLQYHLGLCEGKFKLEGQETKPAVKLSRLLRPYVTVRSCYSALLQFRY